MKRLVIVALALILLVEVVSADRGFIPPPHVYVKEDSQVAIVAWDGKKEILMLSTNVRANEPAEVWEVIPLPSEPIVEKGDEESFKKITNLYNRKAIELRKMGGLFGEKTTKAGEGLEVIFRKQIGAHDLTVVRAKSVEELEEWIERNLNLSVSANVFYRYIGMGYEYFVFDRISVSPDEKTVEPLIYVFETDKAFYPLVITTETTKSPSGVSLFLVTKGRPTDATTLSKWQTVFFSGAELKAVHEKLWEMFPNGAYVTYFRGYGIYSEDFVVEKVYVPTALDLACEWLNKRFFVYALKQYFSSSWWLISDPIAKIIMFNMVLASLVGLVAYGYFTYTTVSRKLSRALGIVSVAVFYALAICVDEVGFFILATSIPVGIGTYALLAVRIYKIKSS